MAKVFCKFPVERWVTMPSRLGGSLAVLDLEFYLLYFFAGWQYRHLLRSYFSTYCHPAPILTPCSSPGSPASTQEPCPFGIAHWSGSLPDSACPRKFVLGNFSWAEEAFRMSRYWVSGVNGPGRIGSGQIP